MGPSAAANGWWPEAGFAACMRCGGAGSAGYGLLPLGATHEWAESHMKKSNLCYGCSPPLAPALSADEEARRYKWPEVPAAMVERSRAALERMNVESQARMDAMKGVWTETTFRPGSSERF